MIDTHKGSNSKSKKIYLGNTNIKTIYYRNNIVYRNAYEIDLMSTPWTYVNYPSYFANCRAFYQSGTNYIGMEATQSSDRSGYYQGIKWQLDNKEIISYKAVVDISSLYSEVGNGFMIKNASQLTTNNYDAYGYALDFNTGYRQNITLQANVNVSNSTQYIIALLTGRRTEESMLIKSLKVTVRDL